MTTTTTTRFNSNPTDFVRFDSTFLRYDSVQFVVIRLRSAARLEKSRTKSKRGKVYWTPWGVSTTMDGTIYQSCHTVRRRTYVRACVRAIHCLLSVCMFPLFLSLFLCVCVIRRNEKRKDDRGGRNKDKGTKRKGEEKIYATLSRY